MEALAIKELSKLYPTRDGSVHALEQISFSVSEGEFVAVIGPSGCGKSTLLKVLAGILRPSKGEARLRGTPITGPRRDIGVVFQSPVLLPWRSVLDNVLLLMDEPFGALDAMTREQMNLELQRVWLDRKKTVLFITHSIAEAVFLADRVLVLTPRPGRLMEDVQVKIPHPRALEIMNFPEFG